MVLEIELTSEMGTQKVHSRDNIEIRVGELVRGSRRSFLILVRCWRKLYIRRNARYASISGRCRTRVARPVREISLVLSQAGTVRNVCLSRRARYVPHGLMTDIMEECGRHRKVHQQNVKLAVGLCKLAQALSDG
jgi:hypothetical protein